MTEAAGIQAVKTTEDLDELLVRCESAPVMVLKHSTRCPISTHAHQEFVEYAPGAAERGVECAVILVVEDRGVSLDLAERVGVRHQSPQALLLRAGEVVWHDSHERINALTLEQAERREG